MPTPRFILLALGASCFALLAMTCPAAAQDSYDLRWRTPKRSYLLYRVVRAEQAQAKAQRQVVENVHQLIAAPNRYVHLFGYELMGSDPRERCTGVLIDGTNPITVEDLLMQLAMRVPGKTARPGEKFEHTWKFARLDGLLGLSVDSRYEVGRETEYNKVACVALCGTHKLADPPATADESRPFHVWTQFDVTSRAYFNAVEGRLEGARFEVRATSRELASGTDAVKRVNYFDWDLEWALSRSFDSTLESDLRRYVDSAIVRGRDRLLEMRDAEGLWPYGPLKRGGTALALLALLMCGVAPDHAVVAPAFEAMKDLPIDNTYEVATTLMAYEAKYVSDDEKRAFLEGRKAEAKRVLEPEDRREMQRLLDWIVQNQNKRNPFWVYKYAASGVAEGYDLSNTQYALLALATCRRCGLKLPAGLLRTFGDELRALQESSGPELKRVVGGKPPKPIRGQTSTPEDREPRFTRAAKTVKARGWRYAGQATYDAKTRLSDAWGSMTCAGVSCMMIALDLAAQLSPDEQRAEFGSSVNYTSWAQAGAASIESALAWMELHFSLTRNPNFGRLWHYYYLYGIERVGVMCEARYIGEHDWYTEGAAMLVCLQGPSNDWEANTVDTAFALLFLKRGTVPLKTPSPTHDKGAGDSSPR